MPIELVDLKSLTPAAYNPRTADPERLDVVELSLRKFGWLLPVYATRDGEILSGHQRCLMAERIGYEKVPVEWMEDVTLDERKRINILFNRATNDLDRNFSTRKAREEITNEDILIAMKGMPFHPIEDFPCMRTQRVRVKNLTSNPLNKWNQYAYATAKSLKKYKVRMPVIATRNDEIINGIGRVQLADESGDEEIDCVIVEEHKAHVARLLLNKLSMDFSIHERYADILRYNSFRRTRHKNEGRIGHGKLYMIWDKAAQDFDMDDPSWRKRWKLAYGTSVVDFGAGHRTEAQLLGSYGIHVNAFEPFCIDMSTSDQIDRNLSIRVCRDFLKEIRTGQHYDSVFVSYVFNSVPFYEDRVKIVQLVAALCDSQTVAYISCVADNDNRLKMGDEQYLSNAFYNGQQFRLDYEPNILIADITQSPKVQKFHSPKDLYELMKTGFVEVNARYDGKFTVANCGTPKIDPAKLREAIEFEFDLAYPDGERMGLVEEALDAFSERLKIQL